MKFILLKVKDIDESTVVEILKPLLSNQIDVEHNDGYTIIYHHVSETSDIKNSLNSLSDSLLIPVFAYLSRDASKERLKVELEFAKSVEQERTSGIYDLKSSIILGCKVINKEEILNYILDGSGITNDFIKSFAEANLNVSKAAEVLYVHRNTMIYKLDKLKEKTGFDLREFKDSYVLYSLIEKK